MKTVSPEANGFSLVEVVVAMLILTVGVLALAATTGHVFTQLQDAGRRTERAVAVQQAVEQIRAMPFAAVRDSTVSIDAFQIRWDVTPASSRMKRVVLTARGPGYIPGAGWTDTMKTATVISVIDP